MTRSRLTERRSSITGAILAFCFALLLAASALAQPSSNGTEALFSRATEALVRGEYSEAIAGFEQLSDRGVLLVNASANRAHAYLLRAESPKRQDGDLGQAAAGFREAQLLDPTDDEIARALAGVRREISQQRARRGLDPVIVELPLMRAVVHVLPENVWAVLALLGSLALAVGLVLQRADAQSPRRLAGQICSAAGAFFLLVFGSLTAAAAHYRETTREAVIVVPEARLLNAEGKPLTTKALDVDASAIPEGASVFVLGQSGRLTRVGWGNLEAWVQGTDLRALGKPR